MRLLKQAMLFISLLFFGSHYLLAQKELVKTVYFNSSSYRISKKYRLMLDRIADRYNSDTSYFIKIFGYTDKTGTETYNDKLSNRRVTAVFKYLNARVKIDTTKVYAMWLGKSDDVYDLHFKQAHFQERCVDVRIVFFENTKIKK